MFFFFFFLLLFFISYNITIIIHFLLITTSWKRHNSSLVSTSRVLHPPLKGASCFSLRFVCVACALKSSRRSFTLPVAGKRADVLHPLFVGSSVFALVTSTRYRILYKLIDTRRIIKKSFVFDKTFFRRKYRATIFVVDQNFLFSNIRFVFIKNYWLYKQCVQL